MWLILTSTTFIDGALHLIAVNEPFPQPQSKEQLLALTKITDIKHIILIQNKMDTNINDEASKHQFKQIQTFVSGTTASSAHVVPISAKLKYNIDVVIQLLCHIPQPKRDLLSPLRCIVIKSNESNVYNTIDNENVNCVIASAMLLKGVIKLGQVIEVKPGVITKTQNNEMKVTPIYTHVVSLHSEDNALLYAVSGGLVGIGMKMEQALMKADKLNGRVIGLPGKLPDVVVKIVVRCCLLKRLMNVKRKESEESVGEVKLHEMLLVNVGACSVGGKVVEMSAENNNEVMFELSSPICCEIREKVAVSRKMGKNIRLIGFGEVLRTVTIDEVDI